MQLNFTSRNDHNGHGRCRDVNPGVESLAQDEAVQVLEQAFSIAGGRFPTERAIILGALAEGFLGVGDAPRARAAADEAIATMRRFGMRLHEQEASLALARVLLKTEGTKAAAMIEATLRRVADLVAETGVLTFAPFVHLERAELARLVADEAARERELREARRLFTEMGAPIRAEQVARELGLPAVPT